MVNIGDKIIRVECGFEYKVIDIYREDRIMSRYGDTPLGMVESGLMNCSKRVRLLCNSGETFSLDYDHVIRCLTTNVLKMETIEPRKHIKKLCVSHLVL
jgi:hypothetical protein